MLGVWRHVCILFFFPWRVSNTQRRALFILTYYFTVSKRVTLPSGEVRFRYCFCLQLLWCWFVLSLVFSLCFVLLFFCSLLVFSFASFQFEGTQLIEKKMNVSCLRRLRPTGSSNTHNKFCIVGKNQLALLKHGTRVIACVAPSMQRQSAIMISIPHILCTQISQYRESTITDCIIPFTSYSICMIYCTFFYFYKDKR